MNFTPEFHAAEIEEKFLSSGATRLRCQSINNGLLLLHSAVPLRGMEAQPQQQICPFFVRSGFENSRI